MTPNQVSARKPSYTAPSVAKRDYHYLGIVALMILVGLTSFFAGTLFNPNLSSPETTTSTQTTSSTETSTAVSQRGITIKNTTHLSRESGTSGESEVILNESGKESIVDRGTVAGAGEIKIFANPQFLSDRYLSYVLTGINTGGITRIYDMLQNKKLGETVGTAQVTLDESRLIACGGNEQAGYAAKVFTLPGMNAEFDILAEVTKKKGAGWMPYDKCIVDDAAMTVTVPLRKLSGSGAVAAKLTAIYSLTTKTVTIQ